MTEPSRAEGSGIVEYLAANGHRMAYYEDENRPGKPARGHAYEAWCAPGCGACAEGYPLPDW